MVVREQVPRKRKGSVRGFLRVFAELLRYLRAHASVFALRAGTLPAAATFVCCCI